MKKKFIFDLIPSTTKEKKPSFDNSFFKNIKKSNRLSHFEHTSNFVELVYKPFVSKNEDRLKNNSQIIKKNLPQIDQYKKTSLINMNTLENSDIYPKNSNKKTNLNLLPKININNLNRLHKLNNLNYFNKKLKNSHNNNIHNKSEKNSDFDVKSQLVEKDSLFLTNTNNYDKFDIFPNTELRNDLLSSIQKIERLLKTPIRQDKRKKLFQKIYNQDENFVKSLKETKKEKFNSSLMDYQNNLMNLICTRMSDDNLRSLSIRLKKIREKNDIVQPIQINWEEYNKLLNNLDKIKNRSKPKLLI